MRHSMYHPSRANGSSVGFFGIVLGIIGFAIFPIVGVVTFLIGCKIDEYFSDKEAKRKIQELHDKYGIDNTHHMK